MGKDSHFTGQPVYSQVLKLLDREKIYAYPNPFVDHFTLNFELDEEVPDTRVCIYTQGGLSRLNYRIGALPAGRHTFNVSAPQLCKGTYVVHVYAGEHDYETIIFKNR